VIDKDLISKDDAMGFVEVDFADCIKNPKSLAIDSLMPLNHPKDPALKYIEVI
jgi:hypothetical protein